MSAIQYKDEADAAWKWWNGLQPNEQTKQRGDRASLAKLRRATSVMEAAAEPVTADLFKALGFVRSGAPRDLPRAALIAAILAHIPKDKDQRRETLAQAIGTPRGGGDTTQLVTPLRLKRMVAARESDDLLMGFRRTIAILKDTANVKDVARQLLLWTDEYHADRARTLFMFDYHSADNAAPDLKAI